jgi:photosystem II stability/assembly factor-like uncharacterized protein
MASLVLATATGLVLCEGGDGDSWQVARRSLEGRRLTAVIARQGVVLAGTTDGIWRSDDGGLEWRPASDGLTARHVRWMTYHPDISDREFVGTEPAAVFVSRDGGGSWRSCPEVTELRDRFKWSLPYSAEAGCVRGFTFLGARGYAAVEVGGVLRSDDAGETWRLVEGSDGKPDLEGPPEPLIYPDVHSITVHPSSSDLVSAPTGGGFYRSRNGGKSWGLLYDCYCRACWVDPSDPQRIVLGPADGVDRNGRVEWTVDGGRTWSPASTGLNAPWRKTMVERFTQVGDQLIAVLSSGELFPASVSRMEWQRTLPTVNGVAAVAVFEA